MNAHFKLMRSLLEGLTIIQDLSLKFTVKKLSPKPFVQEGDTIHLQST